MVTALSGAKFVVATEAGAAYDGTVITLRGVFHQEIGVNRVVRPGLGCRLNSLPCEVAYEEFK